MVHRKLAPRRRAITSTCPPWRTAMWPEEYIARTLRRYCMAAAEAARTTPPGGFLAISYKRLPDAVWETIGPHFGIGFTEQDRETMRAAARYSSKSKASAKINGIRSTDSEGKLDEGQPEGFARSLKDWWARRSVNLRCCRKG